MNDKLIEAVFLYLNGERVSLVQGTIVAISAESEDDAIELYKKIKADKSIEDRLFSALRVPQSKQRFYANASSLFDLLAHLHQDGYGFGHLGHLLSIIEETKYNFYRRLRTASLIVLAAAGLGSFAYVKPEQIYRLITFITDRLPELVLEWIRRTFSLLKNLTFIGAATTCLRYVMFIYLTFYHGISNLSQKLTALLFRTIATGLNLTAYALIFRAAGVATPLSGLLFIAASSIGIIESVARYLMIRYKPAPKDETATGWTLRAEQIREENQQNFTIQEMIIRVFFALMIAAVITTWCFIPGSILLTLGFMAGMSALSSIESLVFSKLETHHAVKLQQKLELEKLRAEEPLAATKKIDSAQNPHITVQTTPESPTLSDISLFRPGKKRRIEEAYEPNPAPGCTY